MKAHACIQGFIVLLLLALLFAPLTGQIPTSAASTISSDAVSGLDTTLIEGSDSVHTPPQNNDMALLGMATPVTPTATLEEPDLQTYTDQEYGFSFDYPPGWEGEVSFSHLNANEPAVINRRITIYPNVKSLSQIRVDVWKNTESLQLQEWFEEYELPLHPIEATIQQSPDIQIAGLPGILVYEPAVEKSHHGRVTALVGYDNIIVRFDYYLNEGGQYQQDFLDVVKSMSFTSHSESKTRLPNAPLIESHRATLQASSCCNWYDPNNNTYPCSGGNCTWWVKYKRPDASNYWGNALSWRDRARQDGFPVGYSAHEGAIVVLQPGHSAADPTYGHVAYVTSVEGSGRFKVSDMGWGRGCHVGDSGVWYYSLTETGNEQVTFIYTKTPPNQPPRKPTHLAPANGSVTNSTSVTLEWKDNGDPDDGPRGYNDFAAEVYHDGRKVAESGWIERTSWTVNNLEPGTYTWNVKAGDGKTNSGLSHAWSFTVDTVAPTGSFTLNHGWDTANSLRVPLDLTASDEHSGVQDVRLGHTCSSLGDWQPVQSRRWWHLSGQHGDTARVCAQFRDRAGNTSQTVERSIRLDFYPAQPSSAHYRLRSDVSAISGEPHQSSSYRLNSTAGQLLASGNYATSSSYRAALGFWPRIHAPTTSPPSNQPPHRPTLLTPPNGSTTDTATPTFTWNDTGDPDHGPQATRSFRVSLHNLDGTQVAESGWISDTSWTAPTLADGTYQWRVKASDGAAESAWTGVWNLTVETGGDPPEPYFTSDYTLGGPGSTFVFTAVHFPPGAQASIALREPGQSDFRTLTQIPVPDSGTLIFVIPIPSAAPPGEYVVRITVNGVMMQTTRTGTQSLLTLEQPLTIVADAPVRTDPLPEGVTIVDIAGASNIYLPLVVR
jgi:surface antigen